MTPTPNITPLLPDDQTLEARRAAFVNELRSQTAPAPRVGAGRRRPTRRVALVACALLATGATAAGATVLLSSKDVAVPDGVGCYDAPSLDANTTIIGPKPDPVAACAALWRKGDIDGTPHATAPALVACTAADKPVYVVPGAPQTCERLNLKALPDDYADAARQTARIQAALRSFDPGATVDVACTSPATAAHRARALLVRANVGAAAVTITRDGPCAARYEIHQATVTITTQSTADAAIDRKQRRLDSVIDDFQQRDAANPCPDPHSIAARLKADLADAGLSDAEVKVDGSAPCATGGIASDGEHSQVTVITGERQHAAATALTAHAAAPKQVTPSGVDGVKLGMTFQRLRAAHLVGKLRHGCELGGPNTRTARLLAPLNGSVNFTVTSPRKVLTITVAGGATARGVGVGATEAKLKARFPKARFDHNTGSILGLTFAMIPKNGGGKLWFAIDDKTHKVTLIGIPVIPLCE
jgi:hypothetical protein